MFLSEDANVTTKPDNKAVIARDSQGSSKENLSSKNLSSKNLSSKNLASQNLPPKNLPLKDTSAKSAHLKNSSGSQPLSQKPDFKGDPHPKKSTHRPYRRRQYSPRFAALDLGTNNCRLLIANPRGKSMRIIDAYSQIVRLGENLSTTGELSDAAMERTIAVLKICAEKIKYREVTHMRCVATQACRGARNADIFLKRAQEEAGITLEIISAEEEARLAMNGCRDLFDEKAKAALVFDIGGGSTEISWVKLPETDADHKDHQNNSHQSKEHAGATVHPKAEMKAWFSLPFGVVNISEKWGGHEMSRETYDLIVAEVSHAVRTIGDSAEMKDYFEQGYAHLVGTSGTVTSIAGVYLELDRYRRMAVDGLWLSRENVYKVSERLRAMDFQTRAQEPCIGEERADLVICGCAILEGILKEWPSERIRVADRGLREGILVELGQISRRSNHKNRKPQNRKPQNRKPHNRKPQYGK